MYRQSIKLPIDSYLTQKINNFVTISSPVIFSIGMSTCIWNGAVISMAVVGGISKIIQTCFQAEGIIGYPFYIRLFSSKVES